MKSMRSSWIDQRRTPGTTSSSAAATVLGSLTPESSHLDVDLAGVLVLVQVAQHLAVVLEALHRRRQELRQPAGIDRLRLDQVVDAALEVAARRVHRPDHHLVAQHEALVDVVGRHLDAPVAPRHAGENEHTVLAEYPRSLEHERAEAGRLEH